MWLAACERTVVCVLDGLPHHHLEAVEERARELLLLPAWPQGGETGHKSYQPECMAATTYTNTITTTAALRPKSRGCPSSLPACLPLEEALLLDRDGVVRVGRCRQLARLARGRRLAARLLALAR